MSSEEWDVQDSLQLGQGRTPGLLTNIRNTGKDDSSVAERLLEIGTARIPVMRALEKEWAESQPDQTAPLSPPAATQTPSYDQGVANVQAGLNAQPIQQTTQAPGRPQNGEVFPGKFCACGQPRVVAAGISRTSGKPYYRLDCATGKDPRDTPREQQQHPADWGMNPK